MKKNNLILCLIITLIINFTLCTNFVNATGELTVRQTGGTSVQEGVSRQNVAVELTNTTSATLTNVTATIDSSSLTYEPYSDKTYLVGTIQPQKSANAVWEMNTGSLELGLYYNIPIKITSSEGVTAIFNAKIYAIPRDTDTGDYGDPVTKSPRATITISPASEKLQVGKSTNLTVSIINTGNTPLNDITLSMNSLPEGVTPNNTDTNLQVGSIKSGSGKNINFPIVINKSIEAKNYGFGATINATDGDKKSVSFSQTTFIPIGGNNSTGTANISISDFYVPSETKVGGSFNASFTIKNDSSNSIKNLKITVKGGDGLANKTKNIFTEANFPANTSKNYMTTFITLDKTENKGIPIELIVEYTEDGVKEPITFSQFQNIFIEGNGSVKTPQLIVSGYNYGGTAVKAGEKFKLNFSLFNTSRDKDLQNIKISFSSDDGTFIPVGSSNTIFIENIGARKSVGNTIQLTSKPDSAQKTIAATLDMAYEDTSGNPYTAKETISIPVIQKTKLQIDEIVIPPNAYVGQSTGVSVNFYNIGKTPLSNLTVTAEGNFEAPQSPSYFGGNLEPGKQDSYELSFIPSDVGSIDGKIIFTFENVNGEAERIEKPFTVTVTEAPPIEDGQVPPPEKTGMPSWQKITLVTGILVTIGIVIFILKHKKKKKERELTIDEE